MRTSDKRYFEDSKLVQDFLRDVPNKLNREVETGVDSNGNYIITIKTSAGTTTHKQYRSPDTYHRVGDQTEKKEGVLPSKKGVVCVKADTPDFFNYASKLKLYWYASISSIISFPVISQGILILLMACLSKSLKSFIPISYI